MNKLTKFMLVLLLLLSILLIMVGCGKKTSPTEDFEYEMEDGHVIITGYIGADREIYVPSEIDDRPVTVIGESAFNEYDLTMISLPSSIVSIGEEAFMDCVCLEKIVFSNSLEEINSHAFSYCSALKEVDFPDSLKDIGEYAFSRCESLEKVNLPAGLEHLRDSCFYSCDSLKELSIPENTDLHIKKLEETHPLAGSFTTFVSPIGHITQPSSNPIEQFSTVLSVKSGSSTHTQVSEHEEYLCIKVK